MTAWELYSQRAIDGLGPAVVHLPVQRRLPRAAHRLPELPPELGWNRSGQRSERGHMSHGAHGLPEPPSGSGERSMEGSTETDQLLAIC